MDDNGIAAVSYTVEAPEGQADRLGLQCLSGSMPLDDHELIDAASETASFQSRAAYFTPLSSVDPADSLTLRFMTAGGMTREIRLEASPLPSRELSGGRISARISPIGETVLK